MPAYGIIEGFYGVPWSWEHRSEVATFAREKGFRHYLYAPKGDDVLRKSWEHNWNRDALKEMSTLRETYADKGVGFGFGFSPVSLVDQWDKDARKRLKQKLINLNDFRPTHMALLFDDIPGDKANLAQIQSEVMDCLSNELPDVAWSFCPSYYSFDPLLEDVFGRMPENYWEDLGRLIDPAIEFYWTGDKVISDQYDNNSLEKIASIMSRKPTLWDNSIVNDGKKTSPFLPIKAMYDFTQHHDEINGALINPMNSWPLSQLCLSTMNFENSASDIEEVLELQCPEHKDWFLAHLDWFKQVGLDYLSDDMVSELNAYLANETHPILCELKRWLKGDFVFDPACLT